MPPSRQARAASDMPLPRRKARVSRLSGQRIARAFHRINFIMISEKKWGRPCRYHVEEGLPQECPYPSAYRGCASFSFLRHCIILKKAVAFRHRRIPDAKRPHTEKRRAICIDSRRSRPVPQRPETAHRHRARPDGRGRGGGRARRHPARAVAPADLILLDISMPELSGVEAIPVSGRLRRKRASLSFPCTPRPDMYARPEMEPTATCSKRRTRTNSSSPSGPCSREGSTSALSSPGP